MNACILPKCAKEDIGSGSVVLISNPFIEIFSVKLHTISSPDVFSTSILNNIYPCCLDIFSSAEYQKSIWPSISEQCFKLFAVTFSPSLLYITVSSMVVSLLKSRVSSKLSGAFVVSFVLDSSASVEAVCSWLLVSSPEDVSSLLQAMKDKGRVNTRSSAISFFIMCSFRSYFVRLLYEFLQEFFSRFAFFVSIAQVSAIYKV